jgi:hypothetical protein
MLHPWWGHETEEGLEAQLERFGQALRRRHAPKRAEVTRMIGMIFQFH